MGHCCRIFTPAQPVYPVASVRDFLSGALRADMNPAAREEFKAGQIAKIKNLWGYRGGRSE
jgi:hypothetical protein